MKRSQGYKITAAIILSLAALFWLVKATMDSFSGVPGGIINLIIAIIMFGLTWLSWKRMLLGGIMSACLAILLAIYFNLILPNIYVAFIPMVLMCAPMVISGLLFIEADWTKKVRN